MQGRDADELDINQAGIIDVTMRNCSSSHLIVPMPLRKAQIAIYLSHRAYVPMWSVEITRKEPKVKYVLIKYRLDDSMSQ